MPQNSLQPSSPVAQTLDAFLAKLRNSLAAEGVPFCVLRNYSGFPAMNAGNDIDLLLCPADLPRAVRSLRSITGIRPIAFVKRPYVANLFLHGVAAHPGSRCLEIDLDLSLSWKGLPFLSVEEVLEGACPRSAGNFEFLIPSPEHEAIVSLLVSLIISGFVKEKYLPDVQLTFAAARGNVRAALAPAFGDAASLRLIDAVVSGDRAQLLSCVSPLRRALFWRAFCHRPVLTSMAVTRHFTRELAVRFSPALVTNVAIAGANNERRAELIEALALMLQPATIFIERADCPAWSVPKGADATNESSTRIFKLLKWICSEWIAKFAPKKHLTLRLHENCCFDAPALHKTSRNGWSIMLQKLACRLSPSPDLLLALSSSDAMAGSTGSEQAAGNPRTKLLDCNQPSAELAEEAYNAVIAFLAERTENQMRRFA